MCWVERLTIQIGNLNTFFVFFDSRMHSVALSSFNPSTDALTLENVCLNQGNKRSFWTGQKPVSLWWMDQIMIRGTNKL